MRSLRFLVSRRWILFASWWCCSRTPPGGSASGSSTASTTARHDNAIVERNEAAAPVDVAYVLAPGREVDEDDEWRLVTATGTYLPDETVIVRYRTREGSAGVDVVVPLETADGPAAARRPRLAGHRQPGRRRRPTYPLRRPAGDRHRLGTRRRDRRLHRT